MGWNRYIRKIGPAPKAPSLLRGLIAVLAALLLGALLFVFHASQLLGSLQHYDPWIVSAMPLVCCFMLAVLQGLIYNVAFYMYQRDWENAKEEQQQWAAWAERHLAVLHSTVLLPDALTAAQFFQALPGLEQHARQARRLPEKTGDGLAVLVADLRDALEALPHDLPLDVTLLTDSLQETSVTEAEFTACWQRLITSGRTFRLLRVLRSQSLQAVEDRLKSPEVTVDLILVEQRQGKDQYSDALAALLLASDDVTRLYRLAHHARLLRPMVLDSADPQAELALFFATQMPASASQAVIGDRLQWADSYADLRSASAASSGKWAPDQLHWLEKYAGNSGPFSPWVIAAVTSEVVHLQQADCLMLSVDQQHFITTVTTGNQTEKES